MGGKKSVGVECSAKTLVGLWSREKSQSGKMPEMILGRSVTSVTRSLSHIIYVERKKIPGLRENSCLAAHVLSPPPGSSTSLVRVDLSRNRLVFGRIFARPVPDFSAQRNAAIPIF